MAEMLTKMRVFCSVIKCCLEYRSEYYNFSKQVLNKGGLTLVAKEMFEWVSTLVNRVGKRFDQSSLARDGPSAIHTTLWIMRKDSHLKSLFEHGMKSLHENADEEIVAKLHDELLLKVFHAKIADHVKDYRDAEIADHVEDYRDLKSKKIDERVFQCKLLHSTEIFLGKAWEQNLENIS
jgi:hypothetical protein